MTTFSLPRSPDVADAALNELGELATAAEWKRAALVHAMVLPNGLRKDPDCSTAIQRVTANQFSKRRIHGLSSPHTVAHYRDIWSAAVDAGLTGPARLGREVALPDVPWSEFARRRRTANAPEPGDEPDPIAALATAQGEVLSALARAVGAFDALALAMRDVEASEDVVFDVPEKFGTLWRALQPYRPIVLLPTPMASDDRRAGMHPDDRRNGRGWGQVALVDAVTMFEPGERRSPGRPDPGHSTSSPQTPNHRMSTSILGGER